MSRLAGIHPHSLKRFSLDVRVDKTLSVPDEPTIETSKEARASLRSDIFDCRPAIPLTCKRSTSSSTYIA